MKSSRHLLRVIALLGVVLVSCAQLFGLASGFLCACSGVVMATSAAHCHDATPCSQTGKDCDGEKRQDHAVAKEELQSVAHVSIAAPEIVPVLVAILPQRDRLVREAGAVAWRDARWHGSRPPPAVVTPRAVELLI